MVEEPQQFELLELMVIEELLGDTELEPGRYQQLRFEFVEAVITVRGTEKISPVPSGRFAWLAALRSPQAPPPSSPWASTMKSRWCSGPVRAGTDPMTAIVARTTALSQFPLDHRP